MMASLSGLDIVILVIIGISVITGLFRGFVKELLALGIWILAIWAASHFCHFAANFLKPWIHQSDLRTGAGFALIMLSVLLLGGISSSLLSIIIVKSGLSGTDRLFGMVFGFARAVFIISLLIGVAKLSGFPDKPYTSKSKLYPEFKPVVAYMASFAPVFLDRLKGFNITEHQMTLSTEVDGRQASLNTWRQIDIKSV
jgi:membrane protein required for colicin V production